MTWIVLVQWLHVLAGVVWVGGYVTMTLVVWPALLRRPPGEARALVETLGPRLGALMGASGLLVLVLGLLRGTVFGPIRSFATLFGTAYGLTFLAALVLALFAMGHGSSLGKRLPEHLWDDAGLRPGAARFLRRNGLVSGVVMALLLGCMVLMRFGL